ncbi:MAG TPA: hypothetical protein VM925_30590 [Labilithrix sp.]|nr:hypothetical protein [Labilithrix sp.]
MFLLGYVCVFARCVPRHVEQPIETDAAPALPPLLRLPKEVACQLGPSRWAKATSLRLGGDGPEFARFAGKYAAASFPSGPASNAIVDMEDQGLELRGAVLARDIEIHAARPFVMNGFAVPDALVSLSWMDGGPGTLVVTMPSPHVIVPSLPLRAERSCEDLTLERQQHEVFDAEAAIFEGASGRQMALPSSREVALSVTPGAPPVATLRIPESAANVSVHQMDGPYARIGWWYDGLFVFGWIRTSQLVSRLPGAHMTRSPAFDLNPVRNWPAFDKVVCNVTISLAAGPEARWATVGKIRGERVIWVLEWRPRFSRVWVPDPSWMDPNATEWIQPGEVGLLASTRDLQACARLGEARGTSASQRRWPTL